MSVPQGIKDSFTAGVEFGIRFRGEPMQGAIPGTFIRWEGDYLVFEDLDNDIFYVAFEDVLLVKFNDGKLDVIREQKKEVEAMRAQQAAQQGAAQRNVVPAMVLPPGVKMGR
jgi:hypothetical protein